jgi:hypothetical protein
MDHGMNPSGGDGPVVASYQNIPVPQTAQLGGQIPVLSRAEILGMLQTLEQMRNAGVPPTDRRYVHLVKLLKAQNLSALQRKPTVPNEPAGKPNGLPQAPPSLALPPLGEDGIDSVKPQAPLGPFTASQLAQLKAQILAYRYLSRNLSMPPALLTTIKAMQAKKPAYPPAAYPPGTPARPSPATPGPQPAAPPTPSQPAKLDPRFLYSERERRIASRIQSRISELSQLLPTLEGDSKTKALIEMKQLRLVGIQKKVRREASEEMKKLFALELAAER